MCKINIFDKISFILVLIGSINWGILGLINKNVLYLLLGGSELLVRTLYIVVFLGAIDLIYVLFKCNIVNFRA